MRNYVDHALELAGIAAIAAFCVIASIEGVEGPFADSGADPISTPIAQVAEREAPAGDTPAPEGVDQILAALAPVPMR